jgi:hypothetical protein
LLGVNTALTFATPFVYAASLDQRATTTNKENA